MKLDRFIIQFNWRFLLVRIVVNALALAGTAAVLPKIYFVDKTFGNWLLMALMLGVLNALLKPVLQFLTLQFIFVTYGLVIVAVNSLLLWLLSLIFPNRFTVDSIWWLLLGGLVLGLLSSFLESLFGLTMPIVPDEPPALRDQIEEQARQSDWLAAANSETIPAALVPFLDATADVDSDTRKMMARQMVRTATTVAMTQMHFKPDPHTKTRGIVWILLARTKQSEADHQEDSTQNLSQHSAEDMALYPLAVPYLLNPAGITLLVIFSGAIDSWLMLAIMVILVLLVAAFDWLVFTNMDIMARYLNKARLAVTESVFGILLAALAVELVLRGLADLGVIDLVVH
ncbi:MAG: MarC family protein [Anaerolineae bacterium]